mmetsp:Transcript_16852/g.54449  ORF Transcript_16852/g.54449 Transcript_16852/m.54449 type:complete len:367 (+) Transcript_16852:1642-2742(+)
MPMRPTDRLRTALLPQFREGGGNHSTGSKFCGRRGVKDTSLHWVLQHQRHNLHLPDRAVLGCHKQARRCEGVANDNIARVEILAPRRVFDFPLDGPSLLQDHEREHSRSLGHGQHIGDTCVQVLPVHSKRRLALPSCLAQRIHGEFRGAECTIFHGLRKPPPRMLHLSSAQLQRRPTKQRLERRVDEVSHRRLQLTVHSCVHQFDDRVEEVPRGSAATSLGTRGSVSPAARASTGGMGAAPSRNTIGHNSRRIWELRSCMPCSSSNGCPRSGVQINTTAPMLTSPCDRSEPSSRSASSATRPPMEWPMSVKACLGAPASAYSSDILSMAAAAKAACCRTTEECSAEAEAWKSVAKKAAAGREVFER